MRTQTDPTKPTYQKYKLVTVADLCKECASQYATARKRLDGKQLLATACCITPCECGCKGCADAKFLTQEEAATLVAKKSWTPLEEE